MVHREWPVWDGGLQEGWGGYPLGEWESSGLKKSEEGRYKAGGCKAV